MVKRSSYLDVAKFLFSIVIILFHFDVFFFGGYIMVEAFFMISGFFMMKSLPSSADPADSLGVATGKFVWKKYRSILYFLIPSAVIGCIAYIFIMPRETDQVLMQSVLMLFEILPLQAAGYTGFYSTGVSWYLSAMLLVLLVAYPLAKKLGDTFSLIICPLVSVMVYGYISYTIGSYCEPNVWIENMFHSGLLRGIAGISAGCFLFECVKRAEKKKPSPIQRIIFTALEIAGWWYCVYIIHNYYKTIYDGAVVFFMFGLLLIGISGYSFLSGSLRFGWSKYLANISTVVYLNHYYWGRLLEKCFTQYTKNQQIVMYFILIALSSTVVFFTGSLLRRFFERKKPNKGTA